MTTAQRRLARLIFACALALPSARPAGQAAPGAQNTPRPTLTPSVVSTARSAHSREARRLPASEALSRSSVVKGESSGPRLIRQVRNPVLPRAGAGGDAAAFAVPEMDSGIQIGVPEQSAMAGPSSSFDGLSSDDNFATLGYRVVPPDTVGDVSPTHYVQAVNTLVRVFDKSGTPLTAPFAMSSLMAELGSPCGTTDDGDPIVLYDALADRWLLSQFALPAFPDPPYHQCIAVSQTSNPAGGYFLYDFTMPGGLLNDYPHFGVWPDGYYMTDNQFLPFFGNFFFAGVGAFAFDRVAMLKGDVAIAIYFDLGSFDASIGGMLPADLDGLQPPAPGASNLFSYFTATEFGDAQDGLRVFEFHPNYASPASSTFIERPESPIAVASFNPTDPTGRNDIEQPAPAMPGTFLDAIQDRLLHRLQYRNFGTHESLVVNHTVTVGTGTTPATHQAATRYYELRRSGGAFSVVEQATFAPDAENRWMGSAALDHQGNLAVAYSVSSTATFPSVRYAGRLATDPPNGLFQGEATLVSGTGNQGSTSGRWGDYSALSVDPADDCTFWYTNEYYTAASSATSLVGWVTRIGSFKFNECSPAPQGVAQGIVSVCGTGQPVNGALVAASDGHTRVTDGAGSYAMTLSPGSYTLTASAAGFAPASEPAVISNGGTTIVDLCLDSPSMVTVSATDANAAEAGLDPGVFTISRTGSTAAALAVNVSLGGSAANGSDYTAIASPVTIPAGSASQPVTVTPIDDTLNESNETVVLTVTAGSGYSVGGPSNATVTIVSDDTSPPDMIITSVSAPATGGAGLPLMVGDTTRNQGAGPAPASTTSFYLSTNSSFSGDDVLMDSRPVPALASGTSNTASTTVTIPANAGVGTRYIIARADAALALAETNEANNTLSRSIKIGPDLSVPTLTAPSTSGEGLEITVSATTSNGGGGTASVATKTKLYLSSNSTLDAGDTFLGEIPVGNLGPGTSAPGSTPVTIPAGTPTGTRYIIARADADSVLTETSESNQNKSRSIKIGPDLTVSSVSAPSSAAAGASITITASTRNTGGGGTTVNTSTQLYLSSNSVLDGGDTLIGTLTAPPLGPGGTSSTSTPATIPVGTPAGTRYIIAVADGPNGVGETSESNNTRSRTITIQ